MNRSERVVELKKVSKSYGDNIIFRDFDMQLAKGEMVCIAGESGSGKSTLLNMIGMLDKPDEGDIYLFGEKIPAIRSKLGKEYLRKKLLYIFQNFALVEGESIDYNLEIPLMNSNLSKREKGEMKKVALNKVGLDKPLDTRIYQLSGGEQQRVALARGYLKDFDLLLADEPTGFLDEHNRDAVISMLRSFNNDGKTVLVVSHDPHVMEACDRVIKL
ncbi:ABC transporter ATP-binding protein [Butyrivibrio sp. MC2013]|uniref:ABC transporter ATP-binding protein n=1 Tax=Butyrivibrio sp. MC2013 TaxID=1280686 RepID=UPI00040C1674|nr:ABC transporter ATP-binding protein [Butyrivibrio sp. MC2013]